MEGYRVSKEELEALRHVGPYCFMIYMGCLRPYVDYKTGLVGVKRRISLQAISEFLYEPARRGMCEKYITREQARRWLKRLDKNGIINIIDSKKMIFRLPIMKLRPNEVETEIQYEVVEDETKPAPKKPSKPVELQVVKNSKPQKCYEVETRIPVENVKSVTPLLSNINIIPSGGVIDPVDMCITKEVKMYTYDEDRKPALKNKVPLNFEPNNNNKILAKKLGLNFGLQVKSFVKYNRENNNMFEDWQIIFESWLRRAQIFKVKRNNRKAGGMLKKSDTFSYKPYMAPHKALAYALRPDADNSTIYAQSLRKAGREAGSVSKIKSASYSTGLRLYTKAYQALIQQERENEKKQS